MKKNTLTNKDIFKLVVIIIIMYSLKLIIPLLVIAGIYLFIKQKKTSKIDNTPPKRHVIEQNPFNREADLATLSECNEVIDTDKQIRQETDLRQFQGRNDVTKEELATYMFEQRRWDGIYERRIQMQEIIKVCNLSSDDITWVENELQHYHPDKDNQDFTVDNKCCFVRNEEEKAVIDYHNEQELARLQVEVPKNEKEYQKNLSFMQEIGLDLVTPAYEEDHKKLMETYETSIRKSDYELWLSMKGYVNNG